MKILCIAPNAPPKNSAEAIQCGRFLGELALKHEILLVTTPIEAGWIRRDDSLNSAGAFRQRLEIDLPFHRFATRLLGSRWARFLVPDKDAWLALQARRIVSLLETEPDMIYSRSTPFSSALLARALHRRLGTPWIMHLSDPWVDSPYRRSHPSTASIERTMEKNCFMEASAVAVTTDRLAGFYRDKYPSQATKIFVGRNMLPSPERRSPLKNSSRNRKLRLIHLGALYGLRKPTALLEGIKLLQQDMPDAASHLELEFVGNVSDDIELDIRRSGLPQVKVSGWMTYEESQAKLAAADVPVSVEPSGDSPLFKAHLPSKILEYMAAGMPFLAVTARDSEAWDLCREGYGIAVENDPSQVADVLKHMVSRHLAGRRAIDAQVPGLPARFEIHNCIEEFENWLVRIGCSRQAVDSGD